MGAMGAMGAKGSSRNGRLPASYLLSSGSPFGHVGSGSSVPIPDTA
jgi:hypothetical protein